MLGLACVLVLALQAPDARGEEPSVPAPAAVRRKATNRWVFDWQGWNGLYVEWRQTTRLKSLAEELGMPRADYDPLEAIHLEKLKLAGRIGARVEVDGAAFATTGNLTGFDDGAELRRLRLVAAEDA